ncbi:MAG: hypothetical protein IT357_17180 [Gemmatimonadaceae bacterium]|nr:hypothetical protein [Gemmatimonadaceae bacterium]
MSVSAALGMRGMIALLLLWGASKSTFAIGGLVLVRSGVMWRLLAAPRACALFLSAIRVPFYVSGKMVSTFALPSILR